MNTETMINTLKQQLETFKMKQKKIEQAIDTVVEILPELDVNNEGFNDLLDKHPATCELRILEHKYGWGVEKLTNAISELEEIRDLQ
tara:strand:+ start:28081 stop:28341 length:261 start_codon:yes stop_codon:yes gene_type:complete